MKTAYAVLAFAAAIAAPFLPLACTSNVDQATACNDLGKASCSYQSKCNPIQFEQDYGSDVGKCSAAVASECAAATSVKGTGFTPSYVEGYANALGGLECGVTKSPSAFNPPKGTLSNGAQCSSDSQCVGGLCLGAGADGGVNADGGAVVTCGTCTQQPPQAQAPCAEDSDCPGNQVCTNGLLEDGGFGRECRALLASGSPCATSYSTVYPGSPTPAPSLPTGECEGTLQCVTTDGGTVGACQPLAAAGASCQQYFQECAAGLLCDPSGHCSAPQYLPLGSSCSSAFSPSPASDAGVSYCAGGDCVRDLCVAFAAIGSACSGDLVSSGPSYASSLPRCGPGGRCANGTCVDSATPTASCN
ncbi:MAG TPA: hypothetical protein VGI39_26060 [Polyangiaceae bacterium]